MENYENTAEHWSFFLYKRLLTQVYFIIYLIPVTWYLSIVTLQIHTGYYYYNTTFCIYKSVQEKIDLVVIIISTFKITVKHSYNKSWTHVFKEVLSLSIHPHHHHHHHQKQLLLITYITYIGVCTCNIVFNYLITLKF